MKLETLEYVFGHEVYVMYTGNSRTNNKIIYRIYYIDSAACTITLCNIINKTPWYYYYKNDDTIPFFVINTISSAVLEKVAWNKYLEVYNSIYTRDTLLEFQDLYNEVLMDDVGWVNDGVELGVLNTTATNNHDIQGKKMYIKYKMADCHKKPSTKKDRNRPMKQLKDKMTQSNINAAKSAAQVTAGNTLNKAIMAKVRPQLPMMVRGYADHALADVIVANLAQFAVLNFAENNHKAKWASEAMMVASMTNFIGSFNIDKIIEEVLYGVDINIPENVE